LFLVSKEIMRMPFGKHRGQQLNKLPTSYLEWLLTLNKLRLPLRNAVNDVLESRRYQSQVQAPTPSSEIFVAAEDIVRAGYRHLSQQHHPDKGGDVERMKSVNLAAAWLRTNLRRLVN
jgi:hypothetical protein